MKKLFFIISIVILLQGCNSKRESMYLVCDGLSTTRFVNGTKNIPESPDRKVLEIYQDIRVVETKYYGNTNKEIKEKKKVWILREDNKNEIYEYTNDLLSNSSTVIQEFNVNDNEISLYMKDEDPQTSGKITHGVERWLTINRITGNYTDDVKDFNFKYYDKGSTIVDGFERISNGICKRTEKII